MTKIFPRRTRSLLLFVSAACYLSSFSDIGDPLDARDLASPGSVAVPDPSSTPLVLAALVRRDPFLGERTPAPVEHVSLPPDDGPPVPDIDPHSEAIARDATVPADRLTEPFVVRAVVIGRRPVAFVANGSDRESIVGIGDSLGGARVRAIDLQGIVLADGTRLDLPHSYLATPRPRYRGESRADAALDAVVNLRTLLLRGRFDREPTAHARATPAQASPPEPSPAPLRTVDARGLPPGANPTPDSLDPTAQPYPYPYAPVPH